MRRNPTLGAAGGAVAAVLGLLAGAIPLTDNSFFTHLATGRLILGGDGFPRSDPYTWSSAGEPWTVQSWLASVVYAGAEKLLGSSGPAVVVALAGAGLALCVWALSLRAGTIVSRLLVAGPVLVIGLARWAERPYLFALVFLALTLLACEGRVDRRVLLPIGWLWVQTNGSWPLGLIAVVLLGVGGRVDTGALPRERQVLPWLAGGIALGVLGPYGVRQLFFPVTLLARREQLMSIIEWRAPTFASADELLFIVVIGLVVVAIGRQPSWRTVLPFLGFTALALTGSRNLEVACIVFVPIMAPGLAGLGSIDSSERRAVVRPAVAAVSAIGLVLLSGIAAGDGVRLEPYPVPAIVWLERHDLDPRSHRVVSQDFVGNYLEARYGASRAGWVDDRVEVLTSEATEDYRALLAGEHDWQVILTRSGAEAVLWEIDQPLTAALTASPDWRIVLSEGGYVVAVPSE